MSARDRFREIFKQGSETIKEGIESQYWPLRPQSLNIEITAICDSKCVHCPREAMDRPMRPMPEDLFRRIVDQAAEMKIPEICPNGFGEIMTLKSIESHLAYIRSKSHRFRIVMNTNGFRMSGEKLESLLRHEVDLLNICIDGATKAVAEAVRVNLKLDSIEENILTLMRMRRERGLERPKIRVGMVVIPQNEHEVGAFAEKWRGKVDFVGVDPYSNRAGSLDGKFAEAKAPSQAAGGTCLLPFRELNIWADGKAALCCNDWNAEHVVGDANVESLQTIWRGMGLTAARESHAKGNGASLPICQACNYWKAPRPLTRLWR